MSGYVIGTLEIEDPALLAEYRSKVADVVARYGGTFLVAGGVREQVEGATPRPDTAAVIKFDSVEQAERWYDSPEYRAIRGLRQRSGRGSVLIVDGP